MRDLARHRPHEAEAYLDTHHDEWEQIAGTDPESAADILEALHEEGAADLLTDLSLLGASDVLDEMRAPAAADVLEELTPEDAARLVAGMETNQAVDLLTALEEDARQEVMAALDPGTRVEVNKLIIYPPDSAGGLMTTDFAALPTGITAGEAIEVLRRLHDELGSNLTYVYVVDDAGRLVGVAPFRELVFARPGVGIDEFMVRNPVAVRVDTDREEVAELIQRYHLITIPVIDAQDHMVGIVHVDEAMEAVQAEATEDIAAVFGAGVEETVYTPVVESLRHRLPWIATNLGIALLISQIINQFQDIINQRAILAAFMAMAAQLGGNSGAQALAVTIRAMAIGDLPAGRAARAIKREIRIGIANAAIMATLAGVLGGLLSGSTRIGLIIAIAVFINLNVAALAGASIPIILRRFGLDPAVASNIFLTMITDSVGFGGFLITATILLRL